MNVLMMLADLRKEAGNDPVLRDALLDTRAADRPLSEFCRIARAHGYELCEMDIIDAGAELAATMKRSVNGGGENSPDLPNSDDYYEMFLASLE